MKRLPEDAAENSRCCWMLRYEGGGIKRKGRDYCWDLILFFAFVLMADGGFGGREFAQNCRKVASWLVGGAAFNKGQRCGGADLTTNPEFPPQWA